MKIVVVGAGSVGTLFGSILYEHGMDVTLVEIRNEIVEAIHKDGLKVTRGDSEKVFEIDITNNIIDVENPDLIIFAVKSYDNITAAYDCLKIIGPETIVLTLQNGIGNYETISNILGEKHTVIGTTTFGATQYAPGCTRGSETGEISIGEYKGGSSERIKNIAEILRSGGFTVNIVNDVNSLVWTKLAVNVGINAIGALCRISNGETHSIESASIIQKMAVEELMKVAKKKGIDLDYNSLYDHVVDVTITTSTNKCSMLQDVEKRNLTEIRAINGAIVDYGNSINIDTPINLVLTNLMIATETSYRK
ncbi:ketopantoate reductase family protein [Miniphocaeibacter halophilus]|uniref:Ketopantoate reductase family protein n=1 Tax=Miniphocaeibacter halophilus TaxID=2931922 RepID=A0AC61N143_9FIRM|nr:ketopantoate reductase family protein [Miniphocaeibacter halophilus]QQK08926.1 ketopantoate reductase family protein [Miniphocaeibacter halophilus]